MRLIRRRSLLIAAPALLLARSSRAAGWLPLAGSGSAPAGVAFVGGADGGGVTSATSLTYPFTVSGANPALLIGVNGDATSDLITSAAFNGVSSTLIGKQLPNAERWQYWFYLLNPALGTHNIVISASGTCDSISSGAANYSGVSAFDVGVANLSAPGVVTLTTPITTTTNNDWAILLELGYSANFPPTAGAGATLRTTDATFGAWGIFDSGGPISPAGMYSMTTNRPFVSNGIGHIIGAFKP